MLVHHHSFFVTLPTHFPSSLSPPSSTLLSFFLLSPSLPLCYTLLHQLRPSQWTQCMLFLLPPTQKWSVDFTTLCVWWIHSYCIQRVFDSFFPLLPPRHPFLLLSLFASTTDLLLPTLLFLSWSIPPYFFLSPTNLSPLLITESIHSFSFLFGLPLHICIINCIFFLPFWLAVVSSSIWYEIHSVSDDNHFLGSEESRKKDGKWPMK